MKKTLYSLVLVVIGSIVSYFLGIDFSPQEKKCPPTQQENSLIRIDLADEDDDYEQQLARLRSKLDKTAKES